MNENDVMRASDIDDPSNTYAISRTFATSLKKYVEKKVNELKGAPQKKKSLVEAKSISCGGIDMLDLSEVLAANGDKACKQGGDDVGKNAAESSNPFKGEDPTSKISCK